MTYIFLQTPAEQAEARLQLALKAAGNNTHTEPIFGNPFQYYDQYGINLNIYLI